MLHDNCGGIAEVFWFKYNLDRSTMHPKFD